MSEKRQKFTAITTPIGIAKFPSLSVPDEYEGKKHYKCSLVLTPEEAAPVIEAIDAEAKAFRDRLLNEAKTPAAKKAVPQINVPYRDAVDAEGNPTGNIEIRSSCNAEFKSERTGKVYDGRPAVFDAKGKPLSADVEVWGGSKVRLRIELFPYSKSAKNTGISARLRAVQVIELRAAGQRNADAFGFGVVEGGFSVDAEKPQTNGEPTAEEIFGESGDEGDASKF